jgi:AcrR family transcriptional regulator
MGRKSRAEERRAEILAAFKRCIGRYGIDVPLEQIADEAGVQRSLIRHYLGNRDELVDQMIAQIVAEYPQRVDMLLDEVPMRGVGGLLDAFFEAEAVDGSWYDRTMMEWDALLSAVSSSAQGRYPHAKQQVAQMMVMIVERVATALSRLFPQAMPAACYQVAYGLVCLVQSHESFRLLGLAPRHTALARANAERLIDQLQATSSLPKP